jgi:hypothetical protein
VLGYFTLDLYLVNRVPTISTWIPVVLLEGWMLPAVSLTRAMRMYEPGSGCQGNAHCFQCIFHVWRLEWPGLAEISTIR